MGSTDASPQPPSPPGVPPPIGGLGNYLKFFSSIVLPMFLAIVDQTIVAAALPAIAGEFGHVDRASWVVISYLVAATIAAPVYGRLGDLLGRRRLMFVALTIFMVAGVLCAVSTSIEMLSLARILQGLGAGGLMTLSQALIGETVPPRDRARYQGVLATVGVSSGAFGAVAGGFLTQSFGWRSIFLVGIPVALVAMILVRRLPIRPGTGDPFRFDGFGLLLFALFIISSLAMLHGVQHLSLALAPMLGTLLVVSVVAVVLLIWWEKRASHPLLPIPLLRNSTIWRSDALAACHGGLLISLITFLPIYLRVAYGSSAGTIGLVLLPVAVGVSIGSMITGWMVSRTGRTAIFPSVSLVFVSASLLLIAAFAPTLTLLQLAIALGINSLFLGSVMTVVQITVQNTAPQGMLGTAAASVQFSRSLGSALGTAVVGSVIFMNLALADPESGRLFASIVQGGPEVLDALAPARQMVVAREIGRAFQAAFFAMAGMSVAALLLAWSIPMRRI